MKVNSYILINPIENSYFLEDDSRSGKISERSINDNSSEIKPGKQLKESNFLNNFWKRLIFNPLSLRQSPNSNISSILEEETDSLAFDATNSVLSKKLELPMNSEELLKANEDSAKIYHEDYPYDFILEYQGERLGMMMLDKCFDSTTGEANFIYRFNSDIKNFKGLY